MIHLPYKNRCHATAVAAAKVDDSDPFAFARLKSELAQKCCARGDPEEIMEDTLRLASARDKSKTFDHKAASELKKKLGI